MEVVSPSYATEKQQSLRRGNHLPSPPTPIMDAKTPPESVNSTQDDSIQNPDNHPRFVKQPQNLLDILKALHDTGIQHVLDLPQVVVIGSQSVGKSSLIEAMSGITLPRDSGTCTRCPMECRLQNAPTWSCSISLRFHTDQDGNLLNEKREYSFGPTLYDRASVEVMLRRAQRAILRPSLSPAKFLDDSDLAMPSTTALSFSQNCVCINVTGPNVADQYFYDLPGIIANVREGQSEGDIKLVEDLAQMYIKKPSCIILLVISCETDFENQGGGRLVLQDRDYRRRTIGVLTKPDRSDKGSEARWIAMIQNQETHLKDGWFAVKQPGSVELKSGISWEEARAREQEYFSTTEPWCSIDGPARYRLGSPFLADHLSTILSKLVAEKLPSIQAKVQKLLTEVDEKLAQISACEVEDPYSEVLLKITKFSADVAQHAKGIPKFGKEYGLVETLNKIYSDFRNDISKTVPRFRPWIKGRASVNERQLEIEVDSGTHPDGDGQILYLDETMTRAHRGRTRELPGNVPFVVKEDIIRTFWERWISLVKEHFKAVEVIMNNHIAALADKHFRSFRGLHKAVMPVIRSQLRKNAEIALQQLTLAFDTEELAFTQNEDDFFMTKQKLFAQYKSIHRRAEGKSTFAAHFENPSPTARESYSSAQKWGQTSNRISDEEHIAAALYHLTALHFEGLGRMDLLRLLPSDKMDPAFDIMAEVRAYWHVAFKRFSDLIPQQIDQSFVRSFALDINYALIKGLGLSGERAHAMCRKWLEEDPKVVKLRENLKARKKMLDAAWEKLAQVEFEYGTLIASTEADDVEEEDVTEEKVGSEEVPNDTPQYGLFDKNDDDDDDRPRILATFP